MGRDSQITEDALVTFINQNWEHARHAERSRFWFTSVYSAIMGAAIVVLGQGVPSHPKVVFGVEYPTTILLISAFLGFITVAGILATMKLGLVFYYYSTYARKAIQEWGIDPVIAPPLYSHPDSQIQTNIVISDGPWYLAIFLVGFSGLIGWTRYVLVGEFFISGISAFIILIATFALSGGYLHWKIKKIDEYMESINWSMSRQENFNIILQHQNKLERILPPEQMTLAEF